MADLAGQATDAVRPPPHKGAQPEAPCRLPRLVVTGFAIQAMPRGRTEEVSGRADPLLAAAVCRVRW